MSQIKLTIRLSNADKVSVEIGSEATVYELKQRVGQLLLVCPRQQRLIYKGKVLKDDATLAFYGILNNYIYCIINNK